MNKPVDKGADRARLTPARLREGAEVMIVRERGMGPEQLAGVVHSVRPDLTWGHVLVTAERGGLFTFDLTSQGVLGTVNGLDACGFPSRVRSPDAIEVTREAPSIPDAEPPRHREAR
ncbi:hypothetical protein [Nocardia jiangsuensis]|uniref:Uncharacterized protein n=1 Tax=Nocardia jiangsuensis TaxID=1691563 RepID=A0ABV8E0H3_9NOCA